MLKVKEKNGVHRIALVNAITTMILILIGVAIACSSLGMIFFVYNVIFRTWLLFCIPPVIVVMTVLIGRIYLRSRNEVIIDTMNKFIIYNKERFNFSDITGFEYSSQPGKYTLIAAPEGFSIHLTIIRKDGSRLEMFPYVTPLIGSIPKNNIIDQKKELFDYLVKVTGIEGKTVVDKKAGWGQYAQDQGTERHT